MKVCSVCQERHDDSTACEVDVASQSFESLESEPQIPGFRLDHLLSSAHHAITYRARDVASGRTCLIKVAAATDDSATQAIREAKIAANLFHPSIANFYECGRLDDGRCFFVFEDVDGRPLREILDDDGPPELLDTIEIIREAAEALHALHRSGIIHGSVNPRNIIISMTAGGQPIVRVTDPDLGRLAQRSIISNRFLIDNELDSLRYFSPEQCTTDDSTAQSDVYSLGVVFYEMLAGFPPFDATTAVGLIQQHVNQTPPDTRIENFNLRMLVTHALTEALQKQTRLRQPSINTLARQLRHIEQLATHNSTPPPAGTTQVGNPTIVQAMPPAALPKVSAPMIIDVDQRTQMIVKREAVEMESVAEVDDAPVVRTRMISLNEALEEDRATLTNLETPSPRRPSLMQSWKEKLYAVTSMFAIERSGEPAVAESAETDAIDDVQLATTTGERVPKKIGWVQPDDDIPSIDAVREVLAMDHDVPLAVFTPERDVEPMTALTHEVEIEPVRRAPKKIEWSQPDDDIPSIDAIQEILALEPEMSHVASAFKANHFSIPEIIHVEPVPVEPEVTTVAAAPSEFEVSGLLVESAQCEPESATATKEPEVVAELLEMRPELVFVEAVPTAPVALAVPLAASESLKDFAVAAVRKRRKKSPRKEQKADPEAIKIEGVVEPLQCESEITRAESEISISPELAVEPREIIDVDAAISEPPQVVVETQHAEPEVMLVQSADDVDAAISEPPQVVVETQHAEPEVMLVESADEVDSPQSVVVEIDPVPSAPEIVAAPPSSPAPVKPSVVAAVRKRHKKLVRRQPVKLVVEPELEPQEICIEGPAVEPQVIQVEPANAAPQEIVVEPQSDEPDVAHFEGAKAEPQEVVVEPVHLEPQTIQVEPAACEPQEIVVEPTVAQVEVPTPEVRPEVIHTEPATANPTVLAFVPKQKKKPSRSQPAAAATPVGTDDEEITIVRPRKKNKRVRIHVTMPAATHKPLRATQISNEPEFFPTLLGGSLDPTGFTSDQSDGMFATYSTESSHPIARYSSHFIGGGLIAVFALLLYGGDFLVGYLQSSGSMTAEAIRPSGTNRPNASTTKPNVPKAAMDDNQVFDKPVVEKKERSAQKIKASVSPDTGTSIPHDSLMKAMIVLPPKSAQVEAMSQTDASGPKRRAEDKVVPRQNETRPRVVKDPSP
ncbi:MAG: hypothetical protein DMF63_00655 [Acidobacteria bacterium]|nr:MAG: hypothetical protein DMF63_00655 [Acidobacteriota bacterium]